MSGMHGRARRCRRNAPGNKTEAEERARMNHDAAPDVHIHDGAAAQACPIAIVDPLHGEINVRRARTAAPELVRRPFSGALVLVMCSGATRAC